MSEILVYSIPGNPFVRVVQIMLEKKHASYRAKAISPAGLKTPQHPKRHPFGRVAAIGHGDFILSETHAILRCLDAVLPDPVMQPTEPRTIGRTNQRLNMQRTQHPGPVLGG